jgi:hypothetical protein
MKHHRMAFPKALYFNRISFVLKFRQNKRIRFLVKENVLLTIVQKELSKESEDCVIAALILFSARILQSRRYSQAGKKFLQPKVISFFSCNNKYAVKIFL